MKKLRRWAKVNADRTDEHIYDKKTSKERISQSYSGEKLDVSTWLTHWVGTHKAIKGKGGPG